MKRHQGYRAAASLQTRCVRIPAFPGGAPTKRKTSFTCLPNPEATREDRWKLKEANPAFKKKE